MTGVPEMIGEVRDDRQEMQACDSQVEPTQATPEPLKTTPGTRRLERGIRSVAGVSLIELVVTVAILGVLAAMIVPLAQVSIQREREIELRRALREIRSAIDEYKKTADAGRIAIKFESRGYPPTLKALVEGVEEVGKINRKLKFLRRIPVDPMTNSTDWGLRSYQDDFDSTTWGEQNVYDVYSKSTKKGLDGSPYNTW